MGAMANLGRPNSGGSQFFVNLKHNEAFDYFTEGRSKHPVFGQVKDGYEVCARISAVPKLDGAEGTPEDPIQMIKVTIKYPDSTAAASKETKQTDDIGDVVSVES